MREVKYLKLTKKSWGKKTSKAFTATLTSSEIVLEGRCPRCNDSMVHREMRKIVVGNLIAPVEPMEREITLLCRCDKAHPGAGKNKGCGAYWALHARLERAQP